MPPSVSKNLPRFHGTTKVIDFPERPICQYCKKPMRILKSSAPVPVVGLLENYEVVRVYYRCGQALCSGGEEPAISAKNAIYPPKSDFDYEIYAKVAELRWKCKHTYEEIIIEMDKQFGVLLNLATVERMLKVYEIGCSEKYKPDLVEKIRKNGGVLLTIDGMKPTPGNPGLYAARDHFTGLAILSEALKSESTKKIVEFLEIVNERISEELRVPVIAIMSDALPAQRKAVEIVFPDVPHCLCHYHFYKLVFDAPKKLDSNLSTQTRKFLNALYYLKKSTLYDNQGDGWEPVSALTRELIEALISLSRWKPRPKDPYFVGLEAFSRLEDLCSILSFLATGLKNVEGLFPDEKVIQGLQTKVKEYIESKKDDVAELRRVKEYLAAIKAILDDESRSGEESLKQLEKYSEFLNTKRSSGACGETEGKFIEALEKYLNNKGKLLFNYKQVKGAPRTNNSHELAYKQLKHFLRRVIGAQTATCYLLSHGKRIIFVDPNEKFEIIVEILKATDHQKARDTIRLERISRDSIKVIVHDPKKWANKIEELRNKCKELLEHLLMKN